MRELRTPQMDKLYALLEWLREREVLGSVVRRERSAASPGIHDLFLFRRSRDGRVFGGRFVEVKRRILKPSWREPVSASQRAEIQFLRSLGLKASIVYVIETTSKAGPAVRIESRIK